MNEARFADEIRERERQRRRREFWWNAASVAFHVALFGAIVLLTPARSLLSRANSPNARSSTVRSISRRRRLWLT